MKRRKFIQSASLSGLGVAVGSSLVSGCNDKISQRETVIGASQKENFPIVIATWDVKDAVNKAGEVLMQGKSSIDAVELGCNVEELNANNQTVGLGGLPDRDGNVTLDACMMNKDGNYGAVVCMQNIAEAISVARKVMEDTPHCILAGKGAEKFALSKGFKKQNLLTDASKKAWEQWKIKSKYQPVINIENHDTIGMLAIDKNGDISGGCTTSGLAYKMAGRVGDSPIVGSGLFIDNEVGGATATGLGEEVLKTVGSFLIVELMRQGKTPQQACEEAIKRIVSKPNSNYKHFQVGYVAMNKKGETGYYSIHKGFSASIFKNGKSKNYPSQQFIK